MTRSMVCLSTVCFAYLQALSSDRLAVSLSDANISFQALSTDCLILFSLESRKEIAPSYVFRSLDSLLKSWK